MTGWSIDLSNRNPILFDPKLLEEASISSKLNLDPKMAEDFGRYVESNPDLAPDAALIGFSSNAQPDFVRQLNAEIEQTNANRLGSYLGQDAEDSFLKATSRLAMDTLFSLGESFFNFTSLLTRDYAEATTGNLGLQWDKATNKNWFEAVILNTQLGAKIAQFQKTGEWPGGTGWWFTDPTTDHEAFKEDLRKQYFGSVTDEFGNEEAYSIGVNVGLGFSRNFESSAFQIAKGITDAAVMMQPYSLATTLATGAKLALTPASRTITGIKKAANARAAFNIRAEELAKELNIPLEDAKASLKGQLSLPSKQNIDELIEGELIDEDIAAAYSDESIIEVEAIEEDMLAIGSRLSEDPNPAESLITRSVQRETVESSDIALGAKERKKQATNKKKKEETEKIKIQTLVKEHDAAVEVVKQVDEGTPLVPKVAFANPEKIKINDVVNVLNEEPPMVKLAISEEIFNSANVSQEELVLAFKYTDFQYEEIDLERIVNHPEFNQETFDMVIDEARFNMETKGFDLEDIDAEIEDLSFALEDAAQSTRKFQYNNDRPLYLQTAEREVRLRQSAQRARRTKQEVIKERVETIDTPAEIKTYIDDALDILNGDVDQLAERTRRFVYSADDATINRILDEDLLLNIPEVAPHIARAIIARPNLTPEQIGKLWSKLRSSSVNMESFAKDSALLFRLDNTPVELKQEIFDSLINVYKNNPGVFDGLDIIIVDEFIDAPKALQLMQTVRKSVIENNRRYAAATRGEAKPAKPEEGVDILVTDEGVELAPKPGEIITRKNANQAQHDYAYKMLGVMLGKFDELPDELIIDLFDSQMYRLQPFQYAITKNNEDIARVLSSMGTKGGKYAAVSRDLTEINGRIAPFLKVVGGPYPTRKGPNGKNINPTMAQINLYSQRLVANITDFSNKLSADVLNNKTSLKKAITDEFGVKITDDSIDVIRNLLITARAERKLKAQTPEIRLAEYKRESVPVKPLEKNQEATLIDLFESGVRKDYTTPEAQSKKVLEEPLAQEYETFKATPIKSRKTKENSLLFMRQAALAVSRSTLSTVGKIEEFLNTHLQVLDNSFKQSFSSLEKLINEPILSDWYIFNKETINSLKENDLVEFINTIEKFKESYLNKLNSLEDFDSLEIQGYENNFYAQLEVMARYSNNQGFRNAIFDYLKENDTWIELTNLDPNLNLPIKIKEYLGKDKFDVEIFSQLFNRNDFTTVELFELWENGNDFMRKAITDNLAMLLQSGKVTPEFVSKMAETTKTFNINYYNESFNLNLDVEILPRIEFNNFNNGIEHIFKVVKEQNLNFNIHRNLVSHLSTQNLETFSEINPSYLFQTSFYNGTIPLQANYATVKKIIKNPEFEMPEKFLAHPAVMEAFYSADDFEVFQTMFFLEVSEIRLSITPQTFDNLFNSYEIPKEDWIRYVTYGKGIDASAVVSNKIKQLAKAIKSTAPDDLGQTPSLEGFSARFSDFKVIINGTGPNADTGYMVARPANGVTIRVQTEEDIMVALEDFYKKNKTLLERETDVYVGGWISDGILYLDISDNVANADIAMELGKLRDQLAVWKIHDTTYEGDVPQYNGKEIKLTETTGGANAKFGSEKNPREIYGQDVSPRYADGATSRTDQAGSAEAEAAGAEISDQVPATSGVPSGDAARADAVLRSDSEGVQPTSATTGTAEQSARSVARTDGTVRDNRTNDGYLDPQQIRAKLKESEEARIRAIRGDKSEEEFKESVEAKVKSKELAIREADSEIFAADKNLNQYNEGVENTRAAIAARVNELSPDEQAAYNAAGATINGKGKVRFTEVQADLAAKLDGPIFTPIIDAISRMGNVYDIDRLTNRQLPHSLLIRLADEGTTPDAVKEILRDAIGEGSLRDDVVTAMNPRTAAAVAAATRGHAGAVAQETMDTNFIQIVLDEVFGKGNKTALRTYGFTSVSKSPYHHTVNVFDATSVARHFQDVIDWSFRTSKIRVTKKGLRAQLAVQKKADELIEKMYRAETVEERIRIRRDAGELLYVEFLKDSWNLTEEQLERVTKLFRNATREIDDEIIEQARSYGVAGKSGDLFAGEDINPEIAMRVSQLSNAWVMWDPQEVRSLTGTIGMAFAKYRGTPPPEFFDAVRNVVDSTWRVLHLARFAFLMRNVLLDVTVRNYAAGLPNIITNPREAIAMIFSDPTGGRFRKLMADYDPYTEDLFGNPLKISKKNAEYDEVLANRPGYEYYIDEGNSWVDPSNATRGYDLTNSRDNLFVKVDVNHKKFDKAWSQNLVNVMYDPIMREVLLVNMGKRSKGLATFMKQNNLTDTREALLDYVLTSDSRVAQEWKRYIEANRIAGKSKETPTNKDLQRNRIAEKAADREGLREILFSEQGSYSVEIRRLTSNYDSEVMSKVEELLDTKVGKRATGEMRKSAEEELINVLAKSRERQGNQWESFAANMRLGDAAPQKLPTYFKNQFNRFVDAQFRWSGYAEKATGYDISYRIRYVESIAELAPLLRKEDRAKLIEYAQKMINKGVQTPGGRTTKPPKRALKQANDILDNIKKSEDIDGVLDFNQFQKAVDAAAAKKTQNLYYKALDQSQFWLAARLYIPFGGSWADSIQKVTRAPFINNRVPAVVQAAVTYQYLLDPRSDYLSDLFQTEEPPEDRGFIFQDSYSGEHIFVVPIIPEVMNRIIAGGASVITGGKVRPTDDLFTGAMRINDLNMFTGQTQDISALFGAEPKSVVLPLPGAGYVLQVANGLMKTFPAYREHFEWLDNYIQPYKMSDPDKTIAEDFIPGWARKLIAAFTPNEFANTLNPYYVSAYTALVSTGQYTDEYGMITPENELALQSDAMAIARLDAVVSGLQQFIGPSTIKQMWKTIGPDDMHVYQHMIVQERVALTKEFNGDLTKAYSVLADKYGWNNILAATPKTTALTYGSTEAYRASNKFPELFNKAPDVASMLFPGDSISPEITAKMREQGQGRKYDVSERLDYLESMVWKVQRNNLESLMVEKGYSQTQISIALDAMKAQSFIGGVAARAPMSEAELLPKRIAQLEDVIYDERLNDNPVVITGRKAIEARNAAMQRVDAAGLEGINAEKNIQIRQALNSVYQQLLQENPLALDLISRLFMYELEME